MEHQYKKETGLPSPWRVVFQLLIIIFSAEAVIMFLLPTVIPEKGSIFASIADATMLVILSAPFLWYFIVHPLRRTAIAEQLQAATIIDHSNDGIITSNEAGMLESFNPAAQRIFGFKAEEVLGKPFTQLMPERYRKAHQQKFRQTEAADEPSFLGKSIELHGLRKDGSEFALELSLSTWKIGTKARYAGIVRDVTERKATEERLQFRYRELKTLHEISRTILDSFDLKYIMDGTLHKCIEIGRFDIGIIRRFNPAEETFETVATHGFRDSKNIEPHNNRKLASFTSPVGIPRVMKDKSVHSVDLTRTVGMRTWKAEGICMLVVIPLWSDEDMLGVIQLGSRTQREFQESELQIFGAIGNQAGTAILKAQLYEEVKTQAARLEKVNQMQADFAAMIAHDLRSPLTNVIGVSEMMLDGLLGPVNEEQKKWLGKLGVSVRNLVNLVNDFLDLSKLEAGHIELAKEEIDLRELIESNLESYQILGRDKKITFRSSIDPDLPRVDADPRRLDQVLSNLLSNAVKFTPEGGQIEVGARTEDGRGMNFWVRDTGLGIPKEEIGNLFEKYKQASNTGKGSENGTGLGLVICKMIVETHGGRIWIDSEEQKGTTVFVSLPVEPH